MKHMKHEATRMIEAQQCEIIAKWSKWVFGWRYEVSEGAIRRFMETMQIEEEPRIDDGIQHIDTFVKFESPTNFKGFEALHNIVLNIDEVQLLCSDFQMESWTYVWWTMAIVWDISAKR